MKTRGLRDKAFLEFVRQVPCALHSPSGYLDPWRWQDGIRRSRPHHLPVIGLKGVGIKSPDAACVPVCDEDHDLVAYYYRQPWIVWGGQDEKPETSDLRQLPDRFWRWNPYETSWRLVWAYFMARPDTAPPL